ncbi:MAG: Cas10/Cmr2 second palm domain-containing protein [Fusobacteriaceae bacterium]
MNNKVLVVVETIKIKDYIFSTNKLKLIRGASYLLDYLNQVEVPKILIENGYSEKDGKITDERVLYIGAGNAKFFANSEKDGEKIAGMIEDVYNKMAPGSKVVTAIVEFEGDTGKAIDETAEKVAILKSTGFKIQNIDLPFIEKCELCATNPAEFTIQDISCVNNHNLLQGQLKNLLKDEKSSKFCNECLQKLIYSNEIKEDKEKIGFYSIFKNEFQEKFPDYIQAEELNEYSDGKSFIGLVYSDGDGLGDFLKGIKEKIKTNEEYQKFIGEFSKKLDEITKNALMDTLEEMRDNFPVKNGKRNYGEFLIVGGDDVCAIFPSKIALKISHRYQEIFEKKMMEFKNDGEKKYGISGLENITTSSGVVIAKSKTPIHYLFEKGLELQKFAKKKRYSKLKNESRKTGYIDFQVIGSEGCVDLIKFRKSVDGLYENPYSLKEFSQFSEFIAELNRIEFPKTKIREIYDLIQNRELEEFEKKMELINTISKMQDKHLDFLIKNWNFEFNENKLLNNFKNIFAVLEVYDFVGVRK